MVHFSIRIVSNLSYGDQHYSVHSWRGGAERQSGLDWQTGHGTDIALPSPMPNVYKAQTVEER